MAIRLIRTMVGMVMVIFTERNSEIIRLRAIKIMISTLALVIVRELMPSNFSITPILQSVSVRLRQPR